MIVSNPNDKIRSSSSCSTNNTTAVSLARRHTSIIQSATPPNVDYVSLVCGLAAGVSQAGLFNPVDRALYLSVKNNAPFLRWEHFHHPYQGFFQSVGHRALSGGLYYPLEQFFMTLTPTYSDDPNDANNLAYGAYYNFLAGTGAGAANALIVNPVSAVKYKSWGRDVNRGMIREVLDMLRKGGFRPFFNGFIPTVMRDLTFGGCYTFLRFELQYRLQVPSEYQWTANFCAAALATVVSGPFNLARNVQYATKSRHIADPVSEVLTNFVHETQQQPTLLAQCKYVQNRLRLGWGTARVAVGMTFGHYVYDELHGFYIRTQEND